MRRVFVKRFDQIFNCKIHYNCAKHLFVFSANKKPTQKSVGKSLFKAVHCAIYLLLKSAASGSVLQKSR